MNNNNHHHPNLQPTPAVKDAAIQYLKGRGAQINTPNHFLKNTTERLHIEAIDDWETTANATQYIITQATSIVNKVDSPDVGMLYSMNPYQGCEHGCIYCYARNVHEYWGYSAGLDFESNILVKQNAPELLRKFLMKSSWQCQPISLSGNTDCYQPAERKFKLTRQLLQVCQAFNQPVGIITKNAGILRDVDIIQAMAAKNLVSVLVSITSLNEQLRSVMEPRSTTS
ncbi:radical SAM protein, partial [Hydrotalea flava]|uniref:radical SAM protein n=1 Tax=Hydrotalea flava TaxID=714549 RepID=UPI000B164E25